MARILVIDDDQLLCEVLQHALSGMGHHVETVHTASQGLSRTRDGEFDVVFLDVRLPDGNGLAILPFVHEAASRPEVIIITAEGDADGAELAIKSGAWDYIEKPSSIEKMTFPLVRALEYRGSKQGHAPRAVDRSGLIGESAAMRQCLEILAEAAGSESGVLVTGETGTGKELFARAIHRNSRRAGGPFIVVDCAAMSETLLESQLFGYAKGAFTGAYADREGLIKQADGGTLFLDEVGELPLTQQKAFLRVLQERRFRPLGAKQEVQSDFRLVAATHRDLDAMAAAGPFRSDLLFRLRTIHLHVPPLRERTSDIRELAVQQVGSVCQREGLGIKGVSPDFLEAMARYDWPGNVRELFGAVEQAVIQARWEPTLYPTHLPMAIRVEAAKAGLAERAVEHGDLGPEFRDSPPTWKDYREEGLEHLERRYLENLMRHTAGDVKTAIDASGLSVSRFYHLLKKHGLTKR